MTGRKEQEAKKLTTTAEAVEVSKQINEGSEDFLTPAKLEKIRTNFDDMDLDRPAPVKTLSQVAKQTVLSNEKSVMDILTAAEKMEDEGKEKIEDAQYWQPEEGERRDIIVTGIIETVIDKKLVKVICFMDKHSKQFIAGATTLVKAMEKVEKELPAVFTVVVKQKVQGEFGKYFTFDIFRL